jgi:tetratricopeptide (TPR) repeat protein
VSDQDVELARLLPSLQEQQKTGTLKVSGDGGRVKYIYLKRGIVELLKTKVSRTLLGKALLKRHKLTDDQLVAALERQKAASGNLRLGEILVGMGIVKESDVHQALAWQIAEEIFELFTWPRMKTEFFRGQPPLDIFEPEDLQARVSLSPAQLTQEAVRRQNELQDIRRTLPSLQDVYALTQRAYRPENEQNPAIQEVGNCIDAQRTVAELLDVVRAPDLVALRVLVKLVQEGDAVPLAAQEILALGQELEERGEFDRARDRYLRAEELGHPDFDLPRRIGQIAEALGDRGEACRRYGIYADRCDQAGYPDVAVATLQRVLDMDPEQHAARERFAELLVKTARAHGDEGGPEAQAKLKQAAGEYERLLGHMATTTDKQRILTELVALQPNRSDLREQLAMVSLELGDQAQAVIDLQELAMSALEAEDLERAARILERILEIDPGDLASVQSLANTYKRLGNSEGAVRQYLALARNLEESGLAAASADTLVEIYEKVVELDPANKDARKYLAGAYEDKKHADKAVGNYTQMVESLRKDGDSEELLEALTKLCELRAGDSALALERFQLANRLGKEEGASNLRSVAEAAQLAGDTKTAREVWDGLLTAEPGDMAGHLALAKLQVQDKDDAGAARRCAAVFELAMIAGSEDLAYDAVKQLLDCEHDVPQHRERLARIQVLRGRTDEAARTLVRAARGARDDENFGLAKRWARRALELDATCDDARDLLENLKQRAAASSPGGSVTVIEHKGPKVQATITGGSTRGPSIQGVQSKATKRVGNIADRLRSMKLGSGPQAPSPSSSEGVIISKKASSAMNKLRAMKSGGGGGSSDASAGLSSGHKISKGPEGPGESAGTIVSKKASSAMDKLRAMKSGGGGGGGGGPAPKKVSKGPEAPGEAADTVVSKKASSAMDRLRAMKSGGGGGGGGGPAPKKVSKGPEAPGEAADASVSKKATSAMDRLRALKAGGGSAPSAAPKSGQKVSKGPEAPGEAADAGVSKKASSAMDRLKALRSGGGGGPKAGPSPGQKVSKGPEAPGEAADAGVSKKASSAMDRLKALRSGGGGGGPKAGPSPGTKISKGPEAPGEAADAGVSKKASSAMDRLKALRAAKNQ